MNTASQAWVAGIITSAVCLMLQVVLAAFKPKLRGLDQKILIQLTVARLVYSFLEYDIVAGNYYFLFANVNVEWAVYYELDAVVVCWLSVYAKILREQVQAQLEVHKWKFAGLSLLIWLLTIPLGVVRLFFRSNEQNSTFYTFCSYFLLSLKVLALTKIIYCNIRIIIGIIVVPVGTSVRKITNFTKKCIISLIVVCIMDTEAIMTMYFTVSETVAYVFGLLNAYQVLAVTMLFVIPAEELVDEVVADATLQSVGVSRSSEETRC